MLLKKYKITIIILLLTTIFSIQTINANNLPLLGMIITVDPGHGRYCHSTQWIETIRTSWFTWKLNFKEIFEKVSLFAY